jgi:hypothetical protein
VLFSAYRVGQKIGEAARRTSTAWMNSSWYRQHATLLWGVRGKGVRISLVQINVRSTADRRQRHDPRDDHPDPGSWVSMLTSKATRIWQKERPAGPKPLNNLVMFYCSFFVLKIFHLARCPNLGKGSDRVPFPVTWESQRHQIQPPEALLRHRTRNGMLENSSLFFITYSFQGRSLSAGNTSRVSGSCEI